MPMARQKDNNRVLVVAGIIAGAYLIINRLFPKAPEFPGGQYEGPDEPQAPTLTSQRMAQLADIIEDALLGNPWLEDEPRATVAICECNNNADLAGLIFVFGERSEPTVNAPFAQNYTLPQAVNRYYSDSQLAKLNSCLRAKGITYLF